MQVQVAFGHVCGWQSLLAHERAEGGWPRRKALIASWRRATLHSADDLSIAEDTFFGRETELGTLERFLESGRRLVTLVGPPGMGKTRLAQRVIERRAARGVASVFVDLATAKTLSDLVHGVATALGIANRDLVDAKLGSALAESGASLMVLDNLEALIDVVAGELQRWLAAAPALRLVVTSRIRVGSRAETILEVGPLGHEAALALMDHTARLHHESLPLPPEERRALSQLVDRLDGLPLALELAAARTRSCGRHRSSSGWTTGSSS